MKENYTKAILEMLKRGDDLETVLSGLKSTLASRGHDRLYPSILRGVVRVLSNTNATGSVVTVVSETDYQKHLPEIEKVLKELESEQKPEIVVDDTIIGGFVAENSYLRVDASYKSKLINLYRSLTN